MSGHPSALPSSQAPSAVEYGGDEISALVLDPGTTWTRAGFAGEDTPKSVIPSHYGYIEGLGEDVKPQYLFGDNDVNAVRANMEIRNPMSDGVVADWDVAPSLWRYALTSRLAQDLAEHPLLMTEPAWNSSKNREKTMEIVFEDFDVPAFYLAKSPVCAAFASGRASCLLIDVGASNISSTPIHEGIILKKGSTRTPLGGDFLSNQIRTYFAQQNIPLSAHYQVISKSPVDAGKPADAVLRKFEDSKLAPTASFRAFQEERVLTEFKETAAQCWPGQGPVPQSNATPGSSVDNSYGTRPFEFPTGYNLVFGPERFRITEGIFNPRAMLTHPEIPRPDADVQGLGEIIKQSLHNVDIDIKPHVLSNVVVTGGSSMVYGFTDRVNQILMEGISSGIKPRLVAPGNTIERRYATWLGGSILASLGSFHQLWVSRKEYDEHGAGIVEKRCK